MGSRDPIDSRIFAIITLEKKLQILIEDIKLQKFQLKFNKERDTKERG